MVVPYGGFASGQGFYLKGRALKRSRTTVGHRSGWLRNLLDNLHRINSRELAGARLHVRLAGHVFEAVTDEEGYFTLEKPWPTPLPEGQPAWLPVEICWEAHQQNTPGSATELLFPSPKANFGIISDVDDTVMQTFVTSTFKLRMIFATLFRDGHQRRAMEGIPSLLRSMVRGAGHFANPIFYVSDSPWNIHDQISEFMAARQIPKGPLLLRDYGAHLLRGSNHKLESFRRIFGMYPNLSFVLLGDTASKDADYYLQMASEFPGRVLAIYIRQTRNNKNARRIARLMQGSGFADAVLFHRSDEILAHAKQKGLI